jgi:hypothetical protein
VLGLKRGQSAKTYCVPREVTRGDHPRQNFRGRGLCVRIKKNATQRLKLRSF